MDIREFLGAERESDTQWRFALGPQLHGAFGGTFGGVLAACCVHAARELAPGRFPTGIDCRFVRGLPAAGRTVASLLHGGRSLSTIAVDILDEKDRLATRGTVSLVERTALRELDRPATDAPRGLTAYDDAQPWPAVAPIVAALEARTVGRDAAGFATAIRVPWSDDAFSAEAACLAADLSVGMPIGATLTEAGERVPRAPNPDLSLRFCGDVATEHLVGRARTERMEKGLMAIAIDVWSGDALVAIGISSALVLPT